jgi:hypothetical protein
MQQGSFLYLLSMYLEDHKYCEIEQCEPQVENRAHNAWQFLRQRAFRDHMLRINAGSRRIKESFAFIRTSSLKHIERNHGIIPQNHGMIRFDKTQSQPADALRQLSSVRKSTC